MAVKLPLLQGVDPVFNRYQTQLQGALAPITNNPAAVAQQVMTPDGQGGMTPNISLKTGSANAISIGLSAPLQGWILTRIKGSATVWDSQDGNSTPSKTLILNSSADVVVQIQVW